MNIYPSFAQVDYTNGTTYNSGGVLTIKGFISAVDGTVDYIDQGGVAHTITVIAGIAPPIAGRIEISSTTAIDLLILL